MRPNYLINMANFKRKQQNSCFLRQAQALNYIQTSTFFIETRITRSHRITISFAIVRTQSAKKVLLNIGSKTLAVEKTHFAHSTHPTPLYTTLRTL